MLYPVILSGGFGGRLWPVSRTSLPKQFIPLVTDYTLLQETVLRLQGVNELNPPILICNEQHRFIAAEQLRELSIDTRRTYLEPVGRNTAPAIAIAAFDIHKDDPDGCMLVLPSDHLILNKQSYHRAIESALKLANDNWLVTFGILPTAPKTGYGYIRKGMQLNTQYGNKVAEFVEKPCYEVASSYLESGEYLWNSGIFLFKASVFLEELKKLSPEIYQSSLDAYENIRHEREFSWIDPVDFEKCPSDSIDYAVMEKTTKAAVIPVDMGWSDVGSWGALWEVVNKDAAGNVPKGNIFMKDVTNCYIRSDREVIAALGVRDLIIIDTDDALLVAHMDKEQEVKDVFKKLM